MDTATTPTLKDTLEPCTRRARISPVSYTHLDKGAFLFPTGELSRFFALCVMDPEAGIVCIILFVGIYYRNGSMLSVGRSGDPDVYKRQVMGPADLDLRTGLADIRL